MWASDWTLDKIATVLAGNVTADVELEDFLQYVAENLRKSLLANHFFHRLYVRMFCKEKMALLDEDAGEYFVELLKTKFEEAGLKDFQNILEHMRDDDPKEKDKLTGKKNWKKINYGRLGLSIFSNGLTDVHVHALCEALKEFPCVSKIDLRKNYLSYRSANYMWRQ